MTSLIPRLRAALVTFGASGDFSEGDYAVLRAVLAGAVRRAVQDELFDGLVDLFFERHLLDDRRREELIALPDEALGFALRHRFRQVVADGQDDRQQYHALRAHVRKALDDPRPPGDDTREHGWPLAIRDGDHFVFTQVRRAVIALSREQGFRPTAAQATSELLRRYLSEHVVEVTESQNMPEVMRRRIDGHRLSDAILSVLSSEERDLLRHVLTGELTVERWAELRGVSRATAYRLLSRLKVVCQLELETRSQLTALEALRAISEKGTK